MSVNKIDNRTEEYQRNHARIAEKLPNSGGNIALIARSLGLSRTTVHKHIKEDDALSALLEDERETEIDYVEDKFMTIIDGGTEKLKVDARTQLTAIMFYLRTRGRNRGWNENLELLGDRPFAIKVIRDEDERGE